MKAIDYKPFRKSSRIIQIVISLSLTIFMMIPTQVYAADPFGNLNKNDFISTNVPTPGYGFGNEYNSYPWSMEVFDGDIYVGTGRTAMIPKGVIEIMSLGGPLPDFGLFPDVPYVTEFMWPPSRFIFDYPKFLDWRGKTATEIWRFHEGTWTQVWQAPLVESTLTGSQPNGEYDVPAMASIRWMQTYTDENGETALYAAAGSTIEILDPSRYVEDPWVLIRSYDGVTWYKVPTDPEMGGESRGMAVHNDKLYFGKYGVWCTDGHPDEASDWEKVFDPGGGFMNEASALASFNGYLWVGWGGDTYSEYGQEGGPEVWRSNVPDPSSPPDMGEWNLIVDEGGTDEYNMWFGTMKVYKDHLYVGTVTLPLELLLDGAQSFSLEATSQINQGEVSRLIEILEDIPLRGFTLIRIDEQDGWQTVIGPYIPVDPPEGSRTQDQLYPISCWPSGFGNMFNFYCWSLEVKEEYLYLGTFDSSSLFQVIFLILDELPDSEYDLMLDKMATRINNMKSKLSQDAKDMIQNAINLAVAEGHMEPEMADILEALFIDPGDVTGEDVEDLLLSLYECFAGADLWKTKDGILWIPVTLNGFDNINNYGFRVQKFTDRTLYVGASNPFQGCEVFKASQEPPIPTPSITIESPRISNGILSARACSEFVINIWIRDIPDGYSMTAFDLSVTWDPNQMELVEYGNFACDRDWIGKEKIDDNSYCLLASKISREAAWSSDAIWATLTFHCLGWGTSKITVESSSLGSVWIWDGDPLSIPIATHPEPFEILCSQLRPFPPRSTAVGGVIMPTNRLSILMPYFVLVGLLGLITTVLLKRIRQKIVHDRAF